MVHFFDSLLFSFFSLREVYLFSLGSQGNVYTLSTLSNLCLNSSRAQKLLVGTLRRKMYCLQFDRHHLVRISFVSL